MLGVAAAHRIDTDAVVHLFFTGAFGYLLVWLLVGVMMAGSWHQQLPKGPVLEAGGDGQQQPRRLFVAYLDIKAESERHDRGHPGLGGCDVPVLRRDGHMVDRLSGKRQSRLVRPLTAIFPYSCTGTGRG
jgi:hypothetical protein